MNLTKNDSLVKQAMTFAMVILVGRCIIIPLSGAMPQDAYYYMYSTHMSLSYFDHPAGVALLLKIGTSVLGNSPAAIKYCAFLTALVTLYAVYRLALHFISRQQALVYTCVLAVTPMFDIISWIVTPDVPLMLFWTLSVLFIYKAGEENKTHWWAIAGLLTGLAFDSKYTAVFILPGAFLYLLAMPDRWRRIFSLNTAVYLISFAVAILPVFLWNMQNHWASISFQTTQRAQGSSLSFKPQYPLVVLAIQLMLLLPWLFYYFVRSFRSWKNGGKDYFLLCFSFPLFIFFIFISFFYWVKINWIMPGFITGSLLAFRHMSARQVKWHLVTAVVVFALGALELVGYPFPVKSHDTWWGWDQVSAEATAQQKQTNADFIFATDDYKTSALLRLYTHEKVYGKNIIGQPALQFDFMGEDISQLNGKNALYVANIKTLKDADPGEGLEFIKPYFSDVKLVRTLVLKNAFGKDSRMAKYYYCTGYTAPAKP